MSGWSIIRAGAMALLAAAMGGCFGDLPQAVPGAVYELEGERFRVETVVGNLEIPWALAWLPDGRLLVTERPGRLVVVENGSARLLTRVQGVHFGEEQGLMGVVVSPTFAEDRTIYLSYTTIKGLGRVNRIASFVLEGAQVRLKRVLLEAPANDHHNGLPLRLGADGKLYAGTGDSWRPELAQRADSLAGKILRMNLDGSPPADNPLLGSTVYALGLRNCQGLDWDGAGRLIAMDHGPSLFTETYSGDDEMNWIRPGGNYGWPSHYGTDTGAGTGFVAPVRLWEQPIAPAGAAYYAGGPLARWKGLMFFATLRGQALYACRLDAHAYGANLRVERLTRSLYRQFGRLRAVAVGPDGFLYLSTSNRDLRGKPAPQDDRVLRLVPASHPFQPPGQTP